MKKIKINTKIRRSGNTIRCNNFDNFSANYQFMKALLNAEPDLKVLSEQVKAVINPTLLMVGIAVGVGSFIVFAMLFGRF